MAADGTLWFGKNPFTGDQEQMLEDIRQHGPTPNDIRRASFCQEIKKCYESREVDFFRRMYMREPFQHRDQNTFPIPSRNNAGRHHVARAVNVLIQGRHIHHIIKDEIED